MKFNPTCLPSFLSFFHDAYTLALEHGRERIREDIIRNFIFEGGGKSSALTLNFSGSGTRGGKGDLLNHYLSRVSLRVFVATRDASNYLSSLLLSRLLLRINTNLHFVYIYPRIGNAKGNV